MQGLVLATIAGSLIGITGAAVLLDAVHPAQVAAAYFLGGALGLSVGAVIPVLRASG